MNIFHFIQKWKYKARVPKLYFNTEMEIKAVQKGTQLNRLLSLKIYSPLFQCKNSFIFM